MLWPVLRRIVELAHVLVREPLVGFYPLHPVLSNRVSNYLLSQVLDILTSRWHPSFSKPINLNN